MADRNSYRITARAEGKGQKTFEFGEKTVHINAAENTVYQIEEVGMSSIPDNIVFSRVNNDLWIMPEGMDTPQAIIEGYFSAKNATFGAMGVDGSLYSYGIEELKTAVQTPNVNTEHALASEVSAAQGASEGGSHLSIPVVSTAALALGGIVVAAGSGGGHSSSGDDKTHPSDDNRSANNATNSENSTPTAYSAAAAGQEVAIHPAANSAHSAEPAPVFDEKPTALVMTVAKPNPNAVVEDLPATKTFFDATRITLAEANTTGAPAGQRSDFYQSADGNHAPETPEFVNFGTLIRGQAKAGDFITRIYADDADNNFLHYYLQDDRGMFAINSKTGVVTLTAAGADAVNHGQNLPDLQAFAHDGIAPSPVSVLTFASEQPSSPPAPTTTGNHAPEEPTFHDSATSFVKGQAQEGDQVTTVQAKDPDNDQVTYYLQGASRDIYNIDHQTGVVTLTAAGANWVNAGHHLPNVQVIAYDGQTTSSIADLDVVNTSETASIPASEPASPVVIGADQPFLHQAPEFHADSTFVDSRDLQHAEKPYFIDVLDREGGNYGYVNNVWGGYGNGATIQYKFADSPHDEGVAWGNQYYSFNVTGFQEYSATQKAAVRDAIALYEEQTKLKFVEKGAGEEANFKFYLDDLKSDQTYAYNRSVDGGERHPHLADNIQSQSAMQNGFCPCCGKSYAEIATASADDQITTFRAGYAWYGGDVHLNSEIFGSDHALSRDTPFFDIPGTSIYTRGGFGVLMHELGHSIGLDHLFSNPNLIAQNSHEDKMSLSIMSYNNDLKGDFYVPGMRGPVSREISATQFGIFDLAALHYRYGVNEAQRAGDSTYTFKAFNKNTLGNDIYIWDGSGVDTFDGSQEKMNLHINLTPGSWIYRGDHKADTLVYDQNGNIVENQMFIGFGTQIENAKGGAGNDELIGNEANNHIEGGAGDDFIDGGAGHDWLEGGDGNDRLFGGEGNDILNGGAGNDLMNGGNGDDAYYVDSAGDQIIDSSGNDSVYSSIDYTLSYSLENLYLLGDTNLSGHGNGGDNILWGNAGNNSLYGGGGDDIIYGGGGSNLLSGGEGHDIFIIDGLGLDTLLDFNAYEDIIQLDHNAFQNLNVGQLSAENFVSGANATAQDADDHLIYNTSNNTLYYDVDGVGGQAAVEIAKFADNFNDEINANNFKIL